MWSNEAVPLIPHSLQIFSNTSPDSVCRCFTALLLEKLDSDVKLTCKSQILAHKGEKDTLIIL